MWKDGTITTDPDYADGTWEPLYTAPPKREWVGLTDEEINKLMQTINWRKDWLGSWAYKEFARAIEAKLKEKNNV